MMVSIPLTWISVIQTFSSDPHSLNNQQNVTLLTRFLKVETKDKICDETLDTVMKTWHLLIETQVGDLNLASDILGKSTKDLTTLGLINMGRDIYRLLISIYQILKKPLKSLIKLLLHKAIESYLIAFTLN